MLSVTFIAPFGDFNISGFWENPLIAKAIKKVIKNKDLFICVCDNYSAKIMKETTFNR